MGDKTLFVNRWGKYYRCYNSMIKHLKLSTREIFIFKKLFIQIESPEIQCTIPAYNPFLQP